MLLYLKTCSFKETNFQRKAEEDDHVHPKQQRIIHVTLHPKFNQNYTQSFPNFIIMIIIIGLLKK